MTTKDHMENLVSVIGCIVDEWKKYGEKITLTEFEHIYSDATNILNLMEEEQ